MRSDSCKERGIRLARVDDRPQLENLWKRCFGDTDAFTRYYFDWYFPHNRVLLCEEEGRILGQLHENEYDFSLYGQQARLPYIVGVSTEAEVRGQGLAAPGKKKKKPVKPVYFLNIFLNFANKESSFLVLSLY